MQLSFIIAAIALMAPLVSACSPDQDCCWSSRQGCRNQHHTRKGDCDDPNYVLDYCENFGVSCGADCCAISTGWGRGCP
ncbi:hypothetical protein BP6252_06805 [Coleophoma cylindrospora]|uniref:Uncharacterized protein n=1 Tax=Coleophoma cylindrospora TaxID=1849047 RepID=A0A3D8RG35_9HELO|nr:hypothetical protein BP6252_06805 [Coleophoma cylindrospora]